ncbi:hypothetical protein [Pseudomonas syringae]
MDMEGLDLLEWFVAMERNPDEWNSVNENFAIRKNINQSAQLLAHEAFWTSVLLKKPGTARFWPTRFTRVPETP